MHHQVKVADHTSPLRKRGADSRGFEAEDKITMKKTFRTDYTNIRSLTIN